MEQEKYNQILGFSHVKSIDKDVLSDKEYMEMVSLHGKENVDNDLIVDLMVFYPTQKVIDAEGREVTITEDDLHVIKKAANGNFADRIKNAYHKGKSYLTGKTSENYDYVTIQLDHDMDMAKRLGYTIGKFSVEEHNGMPYLHTKARIMDYEGKINIKKGLYREISGTVRMDNTIREISFVSSPALKYASILSEPTHSILSEPINTAITQKMPELSRLHNDYADVQQQIKQLKSKLKMKEKQKEVTYQVNSLLKSGKIFPRDVEFYRKKMLKLDDTALKSATTLLQLAEPVINLNKIDVRNRNYFEGAVMAEDFSKVMRDLEEGSITLEKLQEGNTLKGMFGEPKQQMSDCSGGMPNDTTQMSEYGLSKELTMKLKSMLEEGDVEGCKKMLSENTDKVADDPAKTDGDLPDNAKLSEEVKNLKSQLSEYEKKSDKIVKKIARNNELLQEIIAKATGKGEQI